MTVPLFVSGPSGSGKTTLGEQLREHYGWVHVDCEQMFLQDRRGFLVDPLKGVDLDKNTVFTWGFTEHFMGTVETILETARPYRVWLTGPQHLLNDSLRERGESEDFIRHPHRELTAAMRETFSPHLILNVFDDSGSRIDAARILHEKVTGV
jgi:broad-specificity NMP kinase